MLKATLSNWEAVARRNRALFLLIAFLFLLVAAPALATVFDLRLLFDLFMTLIFAVSIYTVSVRRWHYVISTVLFAVTATAIWIEYIFPGRAAYVVSQSMGVLFFLFVGLRITINLIRAEKITANTIFAAIEVYLIAGVLWSGIYSMLEMVHPDSFNLGGIDVRSAAYRMLYFSFVTLTTLGYGDIAPLTDMASAFVILEAIFGQMYITVLIAWLVGRYISDSEERPSTGCAPTETGKEARG